MTFFSKIFAPTRNRRLNELVGLLLCVSALLLFLALASYSPLDPSLNSASILTGSHAARNWVGILGAYLSDLILQFWGVGSFLLPIFMAMLGVRWFRSRAVQTPVAKTLGGVWLLMFVPALLAILPGHIRWMGAIPIEGLAGRIVGDILIRYLNVAGAYIVCTTVLAVALYLTTAFSFSALEVWAPTRFAFVLAVKDRFKDWQDERERKRQQKELEKRRAEKPTVTAQLVPARPVSMRPEMPRQESPRDPQEEEMEREMPGAQSATPAARTGIERMMAEGEDHSASIPPPQPAHTASADIEVTERADTEHKPKTTLPRIAGSYKLPPSSLLHRPDEQQSVHEDELKLVAQVLTAKYAEFEVHGQVTQINPGPVVTTFEFKPEAGIKYSRIIGLTDDLCLALRAESILVERMPGKSTVGIQVPNREREIIWLRENIESQEFLGSKSKLTIAMGKDINGRIAAADLAGMPHLLIAGSTGTGKSVAINAMIMSILYKSTPAEVRLVLVDPKRLELGNYEGVPHLYTPIITEPKLAANALRNAVREMERRLKLLAAKGVRNIDSYNRLFDDTPSLFSEQSSDEGPIPKIVIIIDELADLMMLDGHNVEESITRLAQMARAVGIHLVLATQRPSVDVITGLIKANFPARVSFRVATKVDSRTILDANGAESLLGRGDMLYLPSGSARVHRLHAPFVTEKEIAAVVEFWKAQGQAQYQEKFLETPKEDRESVAGDGDDSGEISVGNNDNDPLFNDAVRLVIEFGKASTSLLQRRLRIGYGRAAHLIDLMERDGIVGAADGPKPREVLKRPDWISEIEESMR